MSPSLMLCNEIQKLGPSILFPDKKVGLGVEGALRIRHSCSQRQEQQTWRVPSEVWKS